MNNDVTRLTKYGFEFYCPGCEEFHYVPVTAGDRPGPVWTWNGSLEKPTLSPSILRRTGPFPPEWKNSKLILNSDRLHICHSFIREGRIEFLGDCTHKLAGQTVTLLLRESVTSVLES